jgi:hypothetical protein
MPNVPTLAELEYPETNLISLFGFYAPASMPADNVRRFNAAVNQILADKKVQEQLRKLDNVVSTHPAAVRRHRRQGVRGTQDLPGFGIDRDLHESLRLAFFTAWPTRVNCPPS